MAITEYIDSIERANWAKHGERASVKDYGAVSDGVADCSAAFQKAYDSMVAKGGGSIDIPGVGSAGMSYKLNTPIEINSAVPVSFYGQGYSSKITRGANLPAGKGLFNLTNAKHVLFRNFLVDGMVTASAGLLYSDFAGNPVNPTLTANTSFWVQGGEDIEWDGVYIEHTGGYAAYLDGVKGARFLRCTLRNNRPHTMGTVAGDLNYGSPTGGVFYYNQGGVKVDGLTVRGCTFERNTGRCVWGTIAGGSPHQQVHVDNNKFTDFGLEAVLLGYTVGGSVNGNSFRRGGYITGNDAGAGAPRRHPNFPSKAIATFGATRLVPCSDNSMVSINGTAIFGDGYGYGIIAGNSIRVPRSGDPEYAEDSIGSGFAAKASGIELWNSQGSAAGATGVSITGNTLDNLDGNALGLHATRKCDARSNLIIMAAGASSPPIVIGGTAGSNQNATENLITGNTIHHAPAAQAPAVFEDPAGRAFAAADQNNVFNNYCVGANVFEFRRDPNSTSTAALFYTTSFVATSQSRHGIQREGTGEGSVLRWYAQDGDPWGWIHMGLQMYRAAGQRCPLLNVSETGPGMDREGGCITTGKVTQMPYGDAIATSKFSASGFLAMGDATFWDVEANLLPSVDVAGSDGWALLRWDGSINKWQQSVTGGGAQGPRVWTDFGAGGTGGGVPGPPDKSIQFNRAGAFGGNGEFYYDEVARHVVLYSYAYNGIQVVNGGFLGENINVTKYVSFVPRASLAPSGGDSFTNNSLLYSDSAVGRLRLVRGLTFDTYEDYDFQSRNYFATGTANNAIQAAAGGVTALTANFTHTDRFTVNVPNGGVNAKWLIANDFMVFMQKPTAAVSALGEVRLYADTDGLMYISTNGQPYGPFMNNSPGAPEGSVQYNRGGQFAGNANLFWDEGTNRLYVTCAATGAGINLDGGWIQSQGGYQTISTGLAVQALSGVIIGRYLATNESLLFKGLASPPGLSDASGGPQVRLYASSGGVMYISSNGAAWGPLMGTGTPPAGASGEIQYNYNGAFGAHAYLTFNFNAYVMTLYGYFQTNAINNTVQWVMNKAFGAGQTVYYVGIDESARYFVQAASYGPVLLYLTPSGDATATMLSTPGTVQSYYVNATGSSALSIQAASGGVTARWICANESLIFLGIGEPARSSGTQVRMYASTSGVLYVSANGQPYGPLAGTPPAGTNSMVQFNANGSFGATGNFVWDNSAFVLSIGGGSGYFQTNTLNNCHWFMHRPNVIIYFMGILGDARWHVYDASNQVYDLLISPSATPTSVVLTTPGWFRCNFMEAGGASYSAINATGGGLSGQWLTARESLILKQGVEPTRAGTQEVRIYANYNGVTYISTNGQAYGPLGGGIQSTTQPQWTATNSGSNYTFNNANNYFIVDGNGNVSAQGVITGNGGVVAATQVTNAIQSAGGFNAGYGGSANGVYQIGGGTVINNSRQFVGYGGINTTGNIITTGNISGAAYQIAGGYYGQDATLVVGNGRTLYFKSGLLYSWS